MCKIIEETIQIQIQEYLDKNVLLYKYQSGFCAKFSTDSYLVQLADSILTGMYKGFHTGMILADLQKALDQTIVLQKKWNVLVLNTFIKWFQLHLSTREIFVTLENVFSYAGLINCGVPQGSILGLLFFLIYINDLPQALNETGSYFYAGDTCTFYQNKDVFLNKEFSALCS